MQQRSASRIRARVGCGEDSASVHGAPALSTAPPRHPKTDILKNIFSSTFWPLIHKRSFRSLLKGLSQHCALSNHFTEGNPFVTPVIAALDCSCSNRLFWGNNAGRRLSGRLPSNRVEPTLHRVLLLRRIA